VKRKPDLNSLPELAQAIRQVEQELGEEGRVLVRYSGTENMCRVMVEGPSTAATEKYCGQLAEIIERALG
jgi:phosphoglucosamine mutase